MPRLISRDKFPPGEFQVLHPEAGMKTPFKGSFLEAVTFEMQFRRKNKTLAQSLGLEATQEACEIYVDEYNAQRCLSHGWGNYVLLGEGAARVTQKKTLLGRVAGVVAGGNAAMSAYMAMFGARGPVSKDAAEKRAAICAVCDHNDTKNGFYAYFVKSAADELMNIIGALKDVDIIVKDPERIGICKICLCPLRAKCHSPISALRDKMPESVHEELKELKTPCWIKQEMGL